MHEMSTLNLLSTVYPAASSLAELMRLPEESLLNESAICLLLSTSIPWIWMASTLVFILSDMVVAPQTSL
jgi:hypothetical protein